MIGCDGNSLNVASTGVGSIYVGDATTDSCTGCMGCCDTTACATGAVNTGICPAFLSATYCNTSLLETRPSAPVPSILSNSDKLKPSLLAIFKTKGEKKRLLPLDFAAEAFSGTYCNTSFLDTRPSSPVPLIFSNSLRLIPSLLAIFKTNGEKKWLLFGVVGNVTF